MATSAIEAFLGESAIAIAGASRSGRKFGNTAARTLAAKGFRVYLLHPTADEIEGRPCYRTLRDMPEPVDSLLIVVHPPEVPALLRQAAAAGVRKVWLQQGAESPEALRIASELGLQVVSGECILMYAAPSGVHRMHRWVHDLVRTTAAS
jgi:predicted CoA-binding protein